MKKTLLTLCLLIVLIASTWNPGPAFAGSGGPGGTAKLQVRNQSSGAIVLNLSGPGYHALKVSSANTTKFEVVPGTYTYQYLACGSNHAGKIEVKAPVTKFTIPPCPAGVKDTTTITVINNTEGLVVLELNGIKDLRGIHYLFNLQPGSTKITVAIGFYKYKAAGCGDRPPPGGCTPVITQARGGSAGIKRIFG